MDRLGSHARSIGASTFVSLLIFGALLALVEPVQGQLSPFVGRAETETGMQISKETDPRVALPLARLEFEGAVRAESLLVARSSGLELGFPATTQAVRTAVRSLHGLGLFRRIQVFDRTPAGSDQRVLAFVVVENPRIAEIAFAGNKKLSDEDLKTHVDLKAGDLLSNRKLYDAQQALQQAYQDEGYASAAVAVDSTAQSSGELGITFRVEEGQRVKIRSVTFEGNQAWTDDELRGKIELKPNSLFRRKRYTSSRMREDVARVEEFYHNHGYKDARVAATEANFADEHANVDLVYTIEEGPLYQLGDVSWSGNVEVDSLALDLAAGIRAGEPFSQAKLDQATSEAYNLYTEKGYLLELMIDPQIEARGDTVDVAFQVQEGRPSNVHEIRIVGNTRTKERVIRRELTLFPGSILKRSILLRSHRDVFALGYFEDVQVDYDPTGEGSEVDVEFRVKEKSSGTATAGAGFSSDTGLTGFLEFGHNNLFGTGKAVNLHLERGGQRETYDISFTEPWAFNSPTSIGFHVFDTRSDLDLYDERQRGFSLNIGRPWFFRTPDYTRVFASYSLEDLEFSDFGDLDESSQTVLRASDGTASRITLTETRNSTDNPFYPTSGSRTTLRTELSGGILGGDLDYYKPTLDHRNYFVPFWKPTVMLRQRLGYVAGYARGADVPGNETFRLGGTRTDYLRGYDDWYVVPEENIRIGSSGSEIRFPGGKIMYSFTAEYQFPIVNPVHGLLFFDAGNTWNSPRDASLTHLKKGIGAGVRLEIPLLGNVGFDYAYGIDRGKWEPHLIIGPAF